MVTLARRDANLALHRFVPALLAMPVRLRLATARSAVQNCTLLSGAVYCLALFARVRACTRYSYLVDSPADRTELAHSSSRNSAKAPARNPAQMLEAALRDWGGATDLWVFGYASLIWRPEFEVAESRFATLYGYHRALAMWSSVNRGTRECPGLVFGLLPGGSCRGMVFRIPRAEVPAALPALWQREMPNGVYDPRWLRCRTDEADVKTLAFTLARRSPDHAGVLPADTYRQIFSTAQGRYGSTRDYAEQTYRELRRLGIHDRALGKLLQLVGAASMASGALPLSDGAPPGSPSPAADA